MLNSFLGTRLLALSIAVAALGSFSSVVVPTEPAAAQIGVGTFWCFQPGISTPVGFAYCNSTHSVEYWAYVVGEYQYSSMDNGSSNRWRLDVEAAAGSPPCSYTGFKDMVLAKSEFSGKTIRFENHSISEETIVN